MGADVAGLIAGVSEGVTRFSVGDRVFGMPRFPGEAAAYSEYVTAPARHLALTPDCISDVEAAALPMGGLTAWHGAYVIATARERNHEFVTELGADEAIDYTAHDVAEVVREMDIVLDLAGGETAVRFLPSLRDGGLLIGVSSGTDAARRAAAGRVRVTCLLVEPDRCGLESIAALVSSGTRRARVAGTFPLADAARAHVAGERGHARGKRVLTVSV